MKDEIVADAWQPCPLFIGSLSSYREEHVIDIMKCGMRMGIKPIVERPGRSRKVMEASNNLAADPYNMRYIHDLGLAYASEGQWEKAANVMLRGWKRASEIEDEHVRFRFLMKLCEASFRISKPRQAFAVLNSMESPPSNSDLLAFQVMSMQVFCAVGDVQKALSTFKKAIDGQDFRDAVTLLALIADDLRAVKAFHPVKDAVNALRTEREQETYLSIVEQYVEAKDKQDQEYHFSVSPKVLIGVAVLAGVLFLLYLLYLLEQYSLRQWKLHETGRKT